MPKLGKFEHVTPEFIQVMLQRLAGGESLRRICVTTPDAPSEALVRMAVIENHLGMSAQYTQAREIGLDCRADAVLDIAADGARDVYFDKEGNAKVDKEIVARSKLRFDAERWYLGKLAPKRYGDRLDVVNTDGTLRPMSDTQRSAKLAALLATAKSRAKQEQEPEDGSDLA